MQCFDDHHVAVFTNFYGNRALGFGLGLPLLFFLRRLGRWNDFRWFSTISFLLLAPVQALPEKKGSEQEFVETQ
jgi:hypothetical protein